MSSFDNGNAVWFLMRGSGVVSLLLLTGVVALGIATWGGVRLRSLPRFATLALHRSLSLLAVVFIAIHVTTAVVDPYAAVRLLDVLVPFGASSRPLFVGLGAIAVDLILALVVTGLLREHIGRRAWRAIHLSAYAAWPVAFIHALGMGSDTSTLWLRALGIGSVATIGASVAWRLRLPSGTPASAAAR
jgi:sulfoxide reductase heme-binding subunit YedZ